MSFATFPGLSPRQVEVMRCLLEWAAVHDGRCPDSPTLAGILKVQQGTAHGLLEQLTKKHYLQVAPGRRREINRKVIPGPYIRRWGDYVRLTWVPTQMTLEKAKLFAAAILAAAEEKSE